MDGPVLIYTQGYASRHYLAAINTNHNHPYLLFGLVSGGIRRFAR